MRAIYPASFIYILFISLLILFDSYKLLLYSLCIFPSLCYSSLPLGSSFSQFDSPRGPRTPLWGFSITFGHTTLGRTPLDEWSARRRDLYLTTHNTSNRHSCRWGDSNLQSQQGSCRIPTSQTARPLRSARFYLFLTILYQSVKCFSPPKNSARYRILPNSKKYVCCWLSYKDCGQCLTFTAQHDYCVQMQCVFKPHWITTEMFTEGVV